MNKIIDVTLGERKLLSSIKRRPPMYLGKTSLTNFSHMAGGYSYAMQVVGQTEQHNILPDGLNDYVAMKYLGHTKTAYDCYSLILQREPDEEKAFYIFFDILDEFLIEHGFKPIPVWDDERDKNRDFFTGEKLV
ncbi:MAG: hypothetical protein IJN85_02235 [Oscillospiraceae bacterium]|nr:hypothetical protein [Oscillospiraceae bacterium]